MPLYIKRLLIAFAVFILLFLVARHFLRPATFGQYGHFRGASLQENAARQVKHVGAQSCISCHDTIVKLKKSGLHTSLNCEACHGAAYEHVKSPKKCKLNKPKGREFCGICHQQNAARPKDLIKQVDLKKHNTESNCVECHNPHEPWL